MSIYKNQKKPIGIINLCHFTIYSVKITLDIFTFYENITDHDAIYIEGAVQEQS